jgi:hypothetical protein
LPVLTAKGSNMGPTCEILLEVSDPLTLAKIDDALALIAEKIERTRKGRVWKVWIQGRPVHLHATDNNTLEISADCNQTEDYGVMRDLIQHLCDTTDGIASEVQK